MSFSELQGQESACRTGLAEAKLVVVKIGSSSLSTDKGSIDEKKIDSLCEMLARLKRRGIKVILVSSGAIRAGRTIIREQMKNGTISSLQALAAIGQVALMESYRDVMDLKGFNVAQILLTWDDFRNKKRLRNLVTTLETLLKLDVIPIINENDTIAVDEIKFGENDTLSALVAVHLNADLLILLSDVDGLYDGDPSKASSHLITCVDKVTDNLKKMVDDKHGGFGGMAAKLNAAKIVTEAGIPMVIANSSLPNVLERIIEGSQIGTLFCPVV
uniref:Glutamate 5-kinase n=1 Tax=Candidatus Methanomethylicus mesodigestus TaxID=1867258 RepID=A0A7C3F6D0_9CREN